VYNGARLCGKFTDHSSARSKIAALVRSQVASVIRTASDTFGLSLTNAAVEPNPCRSIGRLSWFSWREALRFHVNYQGPVQFCKINRRLVNYNVKTAISKSSNLLRRGRYLQGRIRSHEERFNGFLRFSQDLLSLPRLRSGPLWFGSLVLLRSLAFLRLLRDLRSLCSSSKT
jgi:hypothetical protein